jgi:hypothetical protein
LSDRLGSDTMTALFKDGLHERFPDICARWIKERDVVSTRRAEASRKMKDKMIADRPAESRQAELIMRCVVVDWIVKKYPCVLFSHQ